MSAQHIIGQRKKTGDGLYKFCFSLVFMKLPVAESAVRKAASGFVPRENEPSTNLTRVISIKDIYYDYLIVFISSKFSWSFLFYHRREIHWQQMSSWSKMKMILKDVEQLQVRIFIYLTLNAASRDISHEAILWAWKQISLTSSLEWYWIVKGLCWGFMSETVVQIWCSL